MHFLHSEARIRVFEQNTNIIKFWLFYSGIVHEYSNFFFEIQLMVKHSLGHSMT